MTQQDLQIKTSKVVAGLEADKTNELLQAIAFALENKLDSKEAVNAIKNGNAPKTKSVKNESKTKAPPPAVKANKAQPLRDRTPSNETKQKKLPSQRTSLERKPSIKEKEKIIKEKSSSKSKVGDKKVKKVPSKENEEKLKEEEQKIITNGSIESHNSMPPSRKNSQDKNDEIIIESPPQQQAKEEDSKAIIDEPKVNGDYNAAIEVEKENEVNVKPQDELAAIIDEEAEYRKKEKQVKKLSSRHRQKSVEDEKVQDPPPAQPEKIDRLQSSQKRESFERPRTSLRPPSARPTSSRPAAPRRRDKNVEIVLQPEENIKLGNINVRMESFTKELEDDGENLIIIEDPSTSNDNFLDNRLSKNPSAESGESTNIEDDHGHLVQQILETEKNFETALGIEGMEIKKTEIVRKFLTPKNI